MGGYESLMGIERDYTRTSYQPLYYLAVLVSDGHVMYYEGGSC